MTLETRTFRHPGSWWRSAPFWSWNYLLEPESIRREAAELLKSGMGGYFCHSRWGLETEYMSPAWMAAIQAALAEAKRRGGYCWLYDEDRWPSGAAGGLVTIPHPEFRMKSLLAEWPPEAVMVNANEAKKLEKTLLERFAVRGAPGRLKSFRRLAGGQWPERSERLLTATRLVHPDSDWYNRGAYLDTMDPAAVRAFIEHTYEGYRKAVGGEFGRAIPGIFTDEPNYHQPFHSGVGARFPQVPWTDRLPGEFRKRCGYDLLPELPQLFYQFRGGARGAVPGAKVRRDFRRVATELFEEAFSRQLGRWCARHRLAFTGHYLCEEKLEFQTLVVGAAMPHYRHQQLPGIDLLGRRITEVGTCKQVASMVEQFGKERILSELYGGAGWQFSLADQKWMGDWQYALGVNLRCQHLVLTSLRGGRKRDYPPSFFPQTPWWKHNGVVEDYFARLSLALSQGRAVRDLLVVHPIESAWALYTADETSAGRQELKRLDEGFAALLQDLLAVHHDYDLGDESVMARFASVRGRELAVGRARYKAVLVPPCLTLRRTTLRLLVRFAAAGGPVLYFRPAPALLDGAASDAPARVLARIGAPVGPARAGRGLGAAGLMPWQLLAGVRAGKAPAASAAALRAFRATLSRALEAALGRRLTLVEAGRECAPVIYMLRREGARQVLFLANTDFDRGHRLALALSGAPAGAVEEWDAVGGAVRRVEGARREGGVWKLGVELPAAGSRLLVFGAGCGQARAAEPKLRTVGRRELGAGGWRWRRDEPNALVLDLVRWRLRDGELSAPTNLRRAEGAIRQALDYPPVANNGVMRWKAYLPEDLARPERADGPRLELEFEFQVKTRPRGRFALAAERARRFAVYLNGREVPVRPDGCFVDPCMETVPLPAPRRGRNVLRLVTGYRPEHELEDVYLVGDFAVAPTAARELLAEPAKLLRGSWTAQGYSHFGSSITYLTEFQVERPRPGERLVLAVERFGGTALELAVNGRRAGVIPWPPYELDLTRHLAAGTNRLELTVVGSRRNLFGPLHQDGPDPWMIGPGSFPAKEGRERKYNLLAHGLLGRVWLERRTAAEG